MVRINDTDNRNTKLVSFLNSNLVVANVNNDQSVGQTVHFFDAAHSFVQLFEFTSEVESFFFGHLFKSAVGNFLFHFFKTLQGNLNRLEVGEHTAQPALINIRHPGAFGFSNDGVAGSALCADEKDGALLSSQVC